MSSVVRAFLETPVGPIVVTARSTGVCRVSWRRGSASVPPGSVPLGSVPLGAGEEEAREVAPSTEAEVEVEVEVLDRAILQLSKYFAGTGREFDVPVDLGALQPSTRQVLLTLREVPYGSSITYGELGELSGTGLPARAIGSVMGANPVPILIPCHRVLAGDGLGGYSGGLPGQGLETKRWLLEHEGVLSPRLL